MASKKDNPAEEVASLARLNCSKGAGLVHFDTEDCARFRQMQSRHREIDSTFVFEDFRGRLKVRGILPPGEIEPGRLIRCGTIDKPRGTDASILLHLDGVPCGGFQNFRDGLGWEAYRFDRGVRLDGPNRAAWHARAAASRAQRAAETTRLHAAVAARARRLWPYIGAADLAHPYLARKSILAHNARQLGDAIVLPLFDEAGTLWSLQLIRPDGSKRFLKGGRKAGLYFPMGRPGSLICITEGFATGATIHEATGHAVAVAFDCGNLLAVGKALRRKFPDIELRFCADDDAGKAGNPGLTHAIGAARLVGGTITLPEFGEVAA